MACAPYHGHMCASGEPLGAAATYLIGWESRALRVPPMYIVLSSGYRPMAALMAVHALRALSWVHMRVWGAAGSCPHATAEVDIPKKARFTS